jgi:YD repeat-containing protein
VYVTVDNNGNILTNVTSTGTTTYGRDYENRPRSVTLPGTGGTLAFKYDGLGRRAQKVFTQNSTSTTTNYLYDGRNAVADVDQNGNVLARFTQTESIDEPLAQYRSSKTSFCEADGLSSVTSLTNVSGTIGNGCTYDSFGKLTASSGSVINPFQYTGREFDSGGGGESFRWVTVRYQGLIGANHIKSGWDSMSSISATSFNEKFFAMFEEFAAEPIFENKCRLLLDLFKLQIVFSGISYD